MQKGDVVQVNKEHYFTEGYNHKARWLTYFYQLRLLQKYKGTSILEVGPGHGWMKSIARELGMDIKTVDIDPALSPDYVAPINKLPVGDRSFDIACAFEVLEHLPFESFSENLKELGRVAKNVVIISVPDHQHTLLHFLLKVPLLTYKEIFFKIPTNKEHVFDGQHYWEVGKRHYYPKRVRKTIREAGFKILEEFVPTDTPMNRFYVIQVKNARK